MGLRVSSGCLECGDALALSALARGPAVDPLPSAPPLLPLDVLPAPTRPLVAVLPFTANGQDPSLRVLGDELADRLRERLARDPITRAILISSEFIAKAPPHALELICRELRVGHLISGKCHGTGNQPSVYVELTETRGWHIRWAEFYGGGAHALLAEDGAAMDTLVGALRCELVHAARR